LKKLEKYGSIGLSHTKIAATVKIWLQKLNISNLMDLNCPKAAKNRYGTVAHCWKAYLIGYNIAILKIDLKCNPDFSRFFL